MLDLLTPPLEQDITNTTPLFKTIPQGVVLSFVCFLEHQEERFSHNHWALNGYVLTTFENKNFNCFFVDFEISFDGIGQPTGIIYSCHIDENTITLTNRI